MTRRLPVTKPDERAEPHQQMARRHRLKAILFLTLVTFALSESMFWGQWTEAYGRGVGEIVLTYVAYLVVVVVALGLLERTSAGGVRGLALAGALLGWLVEGVVVQTTYEAMPFSVSFTALAWHALVTVIVGWWGIQTLLAGSTRRAVLSVVAAGTAWGVWSAFMAQDPERTSPADGLDAFAAYVLITLITLVGGLLGWQANRGPELVGRRTLRAALAILALPAVATTILVPFAPLVLAPLLAATVLAMRRSPGTSAALSAPAIGAAPMIGMAGLLGLSTILAYAGTQSLGGPMAELWGYTVYIGLTVGGLAVWSAAVWKGLRRSGAPRSDSYG